MEGARRTEKWLAVVDRESKQRDREVEARLTAEFSRLGDRLEQAIRDGWMHCPLAKEGRDHG